MNADRIYLVLLVALPCLYFITFGRTHMLTIDELRAQLAQPGATAQPAWELTGARLEELTRQRDQLEGLAQRLAHRLDAPDSGTPLILDASNLLRAHRLEVETMGNLPAIEHPFHRSARVALAVRGSFPDLFRFVVEIENATPPSRVTTLSIRGSDDGRYPLSRRGLL